MSRNSIKPMILQIILHGAMSDTFSVFNSDGMDGSLSSIRITNQLDVPIIISFDGQYGHEYIPAYGSISLNNQACHPTSNKRSLFRNKTKVYARHLAGMGPKTGLVTFTGYYQI